MRLLSFVVLNVLLVFASAVHTPTRTLKARNNNSPFVSTSTDGEFRVNNQKFDFVGTNAYWLSALNSTKDINDTLQNIKAHGIKVVRTWAFNDVTEIPETGTWFQLIQNGTTSVNLGPNGLQKLDTVVNLAEKAGIRIIFSLTNNWNPLPLIDQPSISKRAVSNSTSTQGTNNSLPRNFLSNDYGGMDVYVRQFGKNLTHDQFFLNPNILNSFLNYTDQIVKRYVNSSAVFSWELANDPRCNSSIAAAPSCNTTTITEWHSTVAKHIASIDTNHLISSGNQGFMCLQDTCPKHFQVIQPPPPQSSATPGKKRAAKPVTRESVLRQRATQWKRTRAAKRLLEPESNGGGVKIRGRWVSSAPVEKRQSQNLGPAMDGSFGVDSQDVLAIPQIGFSTFQLFPDQNTYVAPDPSLTPFENLVQGGVDWIQLQAAAAKAQSKPIALTAFGLVTQNNAPFFVPFNSTTAPFSNASSPAHGLVSAGSATSSSSDATTSQAPFGVTNSQQDSAYNAWLTAAANNGVSGAAQYQWGQTNLTAAPGTPISQNEDGTSSSANQDTTGSSPNDGYGVSPIASDGVPSVESVLSNATNLFP